jgi:hypothetical protein
MRQFMVKCVAVAISLLVALVLVEGVLRAAPSLIGLTILNRFHPDLRSTIAKEIGLETGDDFVLVTSAERSDKGPDFYLMKPNGVYWKPVDSIDKAYGAIEEVTTDERGFCNPARVAGLKTADVATLAGSIPTCSYISGEEIFSSYLGTESALASYNLAVRGVGPYEFIEVLKRYVDDLKPKLVILAISEGNDLRDCQRYIDHVSGKKVRDRQPLGGPFAWSYALAFIKGGIEVAVATVKEQFEPDFRYTVVTRGQTIPMNVANSDTDELTLARAVESGEKSPELYRPPLEEFVRTARDHNFIPLVIIVPNAYTIYDRSITYDDPSVAPLIRGYSAAQRNWLAQNAASIGYQFFDPTDALQEQAATRPLLYFPSNVHPTAEGQKALAEIVAPTVKALLAAP